MPNYRRAFIKGGTFFFTVVTYGRYPIFKDDSSVNLLLECVQTTMVTRPFTIDAIVVLPDHLHTIGHSLKATPIFQYAGSWSKALSADAIPETGRKMSPNQYFESVRKESGRGDSGNM